MQDIRAETDHVSQVLQEYQLPELLRKEQLVKELFENPETSQKLIIEHAEPDSATSNSDRPHTLFAALHQHSSRVRHTRRVVASSAEGSQSSDSSVSFPACFEVDDREWRAVAASHVSSDASEVKRTIDDPLYVPDEYVVYLPTKPSPDALESIAVWRGTGTYNPIAPPNFTRSAICVQGLHGTISFTRQVRTDCLLLQYTLCSLSEIPPHTAEDAHTAWSTLWKLTRPRDVLRVLLLLSVARPGVSREGTMNSEDALHFLTSFHDQLGSGDSPPFLDALLLRGPPNEATTPTTAHDESSEPETDLKPAHVLPFWVFDAAIHNTQLTPRMILDHFSSYPKTIRRNK